MKEVVHTIAHAVEIFYSYAHADKVLRDELEKHLSVLKRRGVISNWYDRLIEPGADWENEIDNHLATAHIILLIIGILVGLAIVSFPSLRQWFITLLATPGLLLWGTIGLLFIIGVVVIILRWLNNR